jgi:hypothetical protein
MKIAPTTGQAAAAIAGLATMFKPMNRLRDGWRISHWPGHLTHRLAPALAVAIAMLLPALITEAKATPTEYALSGTVSWTDGNTDTVSGYFTYNPVGHVGSADITLTGPGSEAGIYSNFISYNGTIPYVVQVNGPGNLYLTLGTDLATQPVTETITEMAWICGYGCEVTSTSPDVTASSAPEPGSLVLLSTALGLILLAGRAGPGQRLMTIMHTLRNNKRTRSIQPGNQGHCAPCEEPCT